MTIIVNKVVYVNQPFQQHELELFDGYFDYNGSRRILTGAGCMHIEDDVAEGKCLTAEEQTSFKYPTAKQLTTFKRKIGYQLYDMLINGDIDFVEFE